MFSRTTRRTHRGGASSTAGSRAPKTSRTPSRSVCTPEICPSARSRYTTRSASSPSQPSRCSRSRRIPRTGRSGRRTRSRGLRRSSMRLSVSVFARPCGGWRADLGTGEKPQRIRLPPNVPWIDIEYNMLTLRAYQKGWLPLSPRPPGEHSAKVAAKKKLALAKTRTSARRGKKAVAAVEESTAPTTNKNGKRVAAVEEEEVEGSPAKRQKRGVKLLMSPKSKETANSQARTGGGRFTRGKTAGTPDVDAVRTPTRTRSPIVVDPADNAASHSRLTIRITPPSKVGQPPVQPAQSKRTTSSESLDVSFPLSPLTSPPCTPSRAAPSGSVSESASPTPKRPMGRCLNPRAFLESKSDSERSEPSPAPSGTQTAVAGTAMSDASSTRAGTPVDDDVFSEKLKKTVKGARRMRASCTPERVSVRIKAKRDGSSPESSGSSDTPLAWRMAGTRLA
ncbi:hypothetical protein C2E23DRAFT_236370 [Lenzites betulinus]|nr:hypothetical protein C2E23DRAFT_236370 [Lenzites betulinus]